MILEYALPIPLNAMVFAALSLLIRWSRIGVYILVGSIVIFIALLLIHGIVLSD
jgi:hypothetical protein